MFNEYYFTITVYTIISIEETSKSLKTLVFKVPISFNSFSYFFISRTCYSTIFKNSDIFISAPNIPVSTCNPKLLNLSLNKSYNLVASSPFIALI